MEFATIRGEPVYIYASALHTQLWIVMPFVNVDQEIRHEDSVLHPKQPGYISRASSRFSCYPLFFYGRRMISKKNMRRWRKERYAASWSTKSTRFARCIINSRATPCVADCVLVASRSVLFEGSLICRHAPCTRTM